MVRVVNPPLQEAFFFFNGCLFHANLVEFRECDAFPCRLLEEQSLKNANHVFAKVNLCTQDLLLLGSVHDSHPSHVIKVCLLECKEVFFESSTSSSLLLFKQVTHEAFVLLENEQLIIKVAWLGQ